ncbi:MAG TPA: ribonuclease P protein component [Hyphomicrobiales bacterium]|nr:ribonuclease P protein component [Hyphomicrobiales bacterium]
METLDSFPHPALVDSSKGTGLQTLKRRADFERVRCGRKWSGKAFLLQGLPQDEPLAGHARFGFVVASKALREKGEGPKAKRPGAFLRNRARRRLKEAIRLAAPTYALANYDYVIIGRYEALHQCFSDLLEELQLAFGKVNRPPRSDDAKAQSRSGREASDRQTQRQIEILDTARTSASGLGQTQDG